MLNISIDPAIYPLLFFHCLIGGIAALVAKQKGYNYWLWLTLGFKCKNTLLSLLF